MPTNLDLKYRPINLPDIVGNEVPKHVLQDMIKNKNIPKYMFFSGAPGSGKTSTAYIMARYLVCENPTHEACGHCASCKSSYQELYTHGSMDISSGIYSFDIGVSSDLEYIQGIAKNIKNGPLGKKKKIIIIDELQMVKVGLQDPLLKATEFIPENTYVIITTSEPKKIAEALKDRADLRIEFTYPSYEESYNFLKELIKKEGIKLSADMLKTLINIEKSNLRRILKTLNVIKDSPDQGISLLIKNKEASLEKYMSFFRATQENILDIIEYIDNIEDHVSYLRGLPYFLKEYIKMSYSAKGYSRKFRQEVMTLLQPHKESLLIQIMTDTVKLGYLTPDSAETLILSIAYQLNESLHYQTNQSDMVIMTGANRLNMDPTTDPNHPNNISNILTRISPANLADSSGIAIQNQTQTSLPSPSSSPPSPSSSPNNLDWQEQQTDQPPTNINTDLGLDIDSLFK